MKLRTLGLTCALVAIAGAPAQASCLRSTAKQNLQRADAVFTGRVLSISANGASARFRVLSVKKGPVGVGSAVRVTADPFPSSITLDWRPRAGERWRIYANRTRRRLITNDCMGTRQI